MFFSCGSAPAPTVPEVNVQAHGRGMGDLTLAHLSNGGGEGASQMHAPALMSCRAITVLLARIAWCSGVHMVLSTTVCLAP